MKKENIKNLLRTIGCKIGFGIGVKDEKRKGKKANPKNKKPIKKTGKKTGKNADKKKTSFMTLALRHVSQMEGKRSESTVQNYKTALRSLGEFMKNTEGGNSPTELGIHDINKSVIEQYDWWLKKKGLKKNTRSCYLRSLRTIYNSLFPEGKRKENPFSHVFTGNAKTEKRAVEAKVVNQLQHLQFSDRERKLQLSRDIFLFSVFAMGMPFVDAYHLKHSQVKNGCITYHRQKTGQQVKVKIEDCMKEIMERYRRKGEEKVFPLPDDYALALNRYNRHLHQLAAKAQISENITSYVARHTWATLAFQEDVALPVISEGMGHTDSHTTSIYIKQTANTHLWKANKKICRLILS